jgi:hypothetical protein
MATLGYSNVGSVQDYIHADHIYASRFQASEDGTVTSIKVFCGVNAGNPVGRCAIYADNNGSPGALLGSGSEFTAVSESRWMESSGLNVPITSGTWYWLAVFKGPDDGTAYLWVYESGEAGVNIAVNSAAPYPTWPNPFVLSGWYYNTGHLSIYAIYTPAETTITLGTKTLNVTNIQETIDIIGTQYDAWQNTVCVKKTSVFGSARKWLVDCVEKDVAWADSAANYLMGVASAGTAVTFSSNNPRRPINSSVVVLQVALQLELSGTVNVRKFALTLQEAA